MKNLNIVPSDKYNWCVTVKITTDGEWIIPSQLTDEEKEQRFSFEMRLSNPRTMGDTYEIEIENTVSSRKNELLFQIVVFGQLVLIRQYLALQIY